MPSLSPIVWRFIEDAGTMTQSLGMGRVLGQVYAYLYFSREPRTLDDMKEDLHISKGSASMAMRQLELWDAAQRVWVRGDRKDYYSAQDYFGRIIRRALADGLGKRLESLNALLDDADHELNGKNADAPPDTDDPKTFLRDRVARLRAFQGKASDLWRNPIVRLLLK
jgi:DNA-binding transcriptional regulator GbsR (MarR family)